MMSMTFSKQKGFNLIEIMVALVVAMIIISGIYKFLTNSQRSYTLVQANDGVNKSMQVSNRMLTNYMRMAGFRNYRRVLTGVTFPRRNNVTFNDGLSVNLDRNVFIQGGENPNPPSALVFPNDSLYLRYFGSSIEDDLNEVGGKMAQDSNQRMYDCAGNFIENTQEVVLRFYVGEDFGLYCRQVVYDTENPAAGATATGPFLIDPNVVAIRFAYRVDGDDTFKVAVQADGSSASTVNPDNYDKVNSVRYGLLVKRSSNQKITKIDGDLSFHMLGFSDGNEDLAIVQSGGTDIYQSLSGITYMRNRFDLNEGD